MKADSNTSRTVEPLYPIWILSEKVEDLLGIVDQHLDGSSCAPPIPPKPDVSVMVCFKVPLKC